jgi:hypothetical protein
MNLKMDGNLKIVMRLLLGLPLAFTLLGFSQSASMTYKNLAIGTTEGFIPIYCPKVSLGFCNSLGKSVELTFPKKYSVHILLAGKKTNDK